MNGTGECSHWTDRQTKRRIKVAKLPFHLLSLILIGRICSRTLSLSLGELWLDSARVVLEFAGHLGFTWHSRSASSLSLSSLSARYACFLPPPALHRLVCASKSSIRFLRARTALNESSSSRITVLRGRWLVSARSIYPTALVQRKQH